MTEPAEITTAPQQGPAPAPPPVDSPEARDALECPLCGYSLRGLAGTTPDAARCPECGYRFEWTELLTARQHRHPYLFEQHPERNTVSFVQTLLGGFRPRRFWSSLHASHAVRLRRLALYWAVTGLVILMTGAGGWYLAIGVGMYRDHRKMIDYYQKYPGRGGFSVTGLNRAYPLPPDRRLFSRLFDERYHRASTRTCPSPPWPGRGFRWRCC